MLIGFQLLSLFFAQCFQTSLLFVQHHHVRELFLVLLGKFFAMRNNILERKKRYRFHSEKFQTRNTGKQLHLRASSLGCGNAGSRNAWGYKSEALFAMAGVSPTGSICSALFQTL